MQPPEELKTIQPFLSRGKELETIEPVVSYFCYFYAIKLAMPLAKQKESTAFLHSLMDQLELKKKSVESQESLTNDDIGLALVENFALKVFLNADSEDRSGKVSKKTALTFLAASVFLEVLAVFGELDGQIAEKIKYSKWKAADIVKCLREGRSPQSGPPTEPSQSEENAQEPSIINSITVDTIPSNNSITPSNPSSAKPVTTTLPLVMDNVAALSTFTHPTYDIKVMESAQKYCRFTISALQYDDVHAAVDNLEKALALLRPLL